MKRAGKSSNRTGNSRLGGTYQTGDRFVEANPNGNRAERRAAKSKRKRVSQ